MNRAHLRFLCWLGTASAVASLAAPDFLSLLSRAVDDAFGTVFPVIPFAALLSLLLLLRWGELRELLSKESGLTSKPLTRFAGLVIVAALVSLRGITGQTVEAAGVAVVLSFYATALILNPLTWRMTLPYAVICVLGVTAPAALQATFGEPLAQLSSLFSAGIVAMTGVQVAWQGTQFALLSRTGELVAATITPGCSSIISVTTFLGLLGLMHIDMRKDISSTAKIATAGVVALTVLNSVRIVVLIWVGYLGGPNALWEVHNWVGYAIFLGFYVAMLLVYPRMGGGTPAVPRMGVSSSRA